MEAAFWVVQATGLSRRQVAAENGLVARSTRLLKPALSDQSPGRFIVSAATGNWIDSLPAEPPRESVIDSFIRAVDGFDLELEWRWAAKLSDPARRELVLGGLGERWLQQDPTAARTSIDNADRSPELREKLLRPSRSRRDQRHV